MSRPEPETVGASAALDRPWTVAVATPSDVAGAARGVAQLLAELGATPPDRAAMEDAARTVVHDPSVGCLLVAGDGDAIVGVLGASWRTAIHRSGRYAVIEELWVDPDWRSRRVGHALMAALVDDVLPRERIDCVEVGLPRPSFPGLPATEAFYRRQGFAAVGPRMRRVIA